MNLHSIKTKLLAAFAAVALVSALVGYLGLNATERVNVGVHETTTTLVPEMAALATVRSSFLFSQWYTTRGIASALMSNRELADKSKAKRNEGAWKDVTQAYAEWRAVNDSLWSLIDAGEGQKAFETCGKDGVRTVSVRSGSWQP